MLRLCYDLGVEDVARLSGGEVNGRHSSLVFLNGSIVGATGCVPPDLVPVCLHCCGKGGGRGGGSCVDGRGAREWV